LLAQLYGCVVNYNSTGKTRYRSNNSPAMEKNKLLKFEIPRAGKAIALKFVGLSKCISSLTQELQTLFFN
jgi:hypothetical protein